MGPSVKPPQPIPENCEAPSSKAVTQDEEDETPAQTPAPETETQNEHAPDGAQAQARTAQHQPSEGLVESSVFLEVSIVNRSGDTVPIAEHSTLEYVEFTETASYRQYSFTSEHSSRGFLQRSRLSLKRLLNARNRFISARSRSFIRRLQREVDLEMQNPSAAWEQAAELEGAELPAGVYSVFTLFTTVPVNIVLVCGLHVLMKDS